MTEKKSMNWNPEVYVPVLLFLLHPPGSLFFSVGVWFTPVCNLHLCHTWLHRVCALQVLLDVVGEPVSGLQRLCPTAAQGRFAGSVSLRQLCCPGVWGAPVLPGSTELMLRWAQEALKVWCALVCGTSIGQLWATDNMEVLEHMSDNLQVTI